MEQAGGGDDISHISCCRKTCADLLAATEPRAKIKRSWVNRKLFLYIFPTYSTVYYLYFTMQIVWYLIAAIGYIKNKI